MCQMLLVIMKQQLPLTKTAFADIASDLHIANSSGQFSGVFIIDLSFFLTAWSTSSRGDTDTTSYVTVWHFSNSLVSPPFLPALLILTH